MIGTRISPPGRWRSRWELAVSGLAGRRWWAPGSRGGCRGTAGIEYGLLLPALLVFVLGLIDTGRLLWTYATLSHAVEAAARCAAISVTQCGSASAVQSYAVTQAWGLSVSTTVFSLSSVSCGNQVTATLPFTFVIPTVLFGQALGTITLTASACYPS
jgi:Flp pilus assembly protein TadG